MRNIIICLALVAVLFLSVCLSGCSSGGYDEKSVSVGIDRSWETGFDICLPLDSGIPSDQLAAAALTLCSGHEQQLSSEIISAAGFSIIKQVHFDKDEDDLSHTCAFSVGRRQITYNGAERTLILISIRGTSGSEWYSNFDFAPSGDTSPRFSENFLFAADDVFLEVTPLIDAEENPLVLVCGHSRGAACANLLGYLLDSVYGSDNIFVYTFATPATLIKDTYYVEYGNIFNYLNAADIVTMLPLDAWGFSRAGTDIFLNTEDPFSARVKAAVESLVDLAPTVSDYYSEPHCLVEKSGQDITLTTFDVMIMIGKSLCEMTAEGKVSGSDLPDIDENSDFSTLFDLLGQLSKNDGELAEVILSQHLPQTYAGLILRRMTGGNISY